jgi:CRISPR-associated protein Csd2
MTNETPNQTISQLRHVILPTGRTMDAAVSERHDMVLLFEAVKSNPNGNPDAANMPRLQPDSLRGLVTDVCLKRKIRNFFSLYNPDGSMRADGQTDDGYEIFIRENAVLEKSMREPRVEALARSIFQQRYAHLIGKEKSASGDGKTKGKDRRKRLSATTEASPSQADIGNASQSENASSSLDSSDNADQSAQSTDSAQAEFKGEYRDRSYRDALAQIYFDIRAFGGVLSTEGPLKSSFYGQVRGPLQISFAESLDRVLQIDATISRCAEASIKEAINQEEKALKQQQDSTASPSSIDDSDDAESGHRTFGRKHLVDYGLYRANIYFSPCFAQKTHFSYEDLDNFIHALTHMFRDDVSAARTGMRVVGLVDFAHTTALGNEHAHKLFETVFVDRTPESRGDGTPGNKGKMFPENIKDYWGEAPTGEVELNSNGTKRKTQVTANRIVWEIPERKARVEAAAS